MTATGELVRASADENPDLLWALRGGGGNFGVVTSFEFLLHPVGPEVAYALVFYDGAETVAGLRASASSPAGCPTRSRPSPSPAASPSMEGVPAEAAGRPMLAVAAAYVGPPDEGERHLRPLRGLATPIADLSGRLPYAQLQQFLDEDYPRGRHYYWKSAALAELSDAVIDIVAEYAATQPSPLSTIDVWQMGGALGEEPAGGSAYAGRSAGWLVNPEADWDEADADEANVAWARSSSRRFSRTRSAPTSTSPDSSRRASGSCVPGSGRTTSAWSRSRRAGTPTTCSGSTTTSRRGVWGGRHEGRQAAAPARRDGIETRAIGRQRPYGHGEGGAAVIRPPSLAAGGGRGRDAGGQ